MEEIPLPSPSTPDQSTFFKKLFGLAQGSILELPSAATGDMLNPGQIGAFGNDLYFYTQGGRKIKVSGSAWS